MKIPHRKFSTLVQSAVQKVDSRYLEMTYFGVPKTELWQNLKSLTSTLDSFLDSSCEDSTHTDSTACNVSGTKQLPHLWFPGTASILNGTLVPPSTSAASPSTSSISLNTAPASSSANFAAASWSPRADSPVAVG